MIPPIPLPPISLEQMGARGELLTRTDRKYLLTRDSARSVLAGLQPDARLLTIAGRQEFRYASTYFDTAALDSFHSTATARRRRWKVRTRSYLETGTTWIEVKTRGSRGRTVKERLALETTDLASTETDRLPEVALAFVANRLRAARVAVPHGLDLRPVLHTAYTRSTVVLGEGTIRLTIDTDLRWQLPDGLLATPGQAVVIETKTPGAASSFDRALWAAGHRPTRLSKFGTGLTLLDPTLPAHRWHRLLTGVNALTA